MPHPQLERVASWTPFFVIIYFALQFLIRIGFSANLETDEAQFVGNTDIALGYGNSHPPLYNWLVAAALSLTGGYWPAAVALVKNLLLAGTYLLAFDIGRRITGRALTGLIIVASFLLLPQIVWKSQITLAHTVLVMFAMVALMHAIVCIAERRDPASYLWLGLAAAIGALAKYNSFLMLAAILVAAYSVPYLRGRLFTARIGYSVGVFAVLFTPHMIWALQHLPETTARIAKLERNNEAFGGIDIPWLGIDGLLALGVAVAAWAGPLVIAWFVVRASSRGELRETDNESGERAAAFGQLFGRTAAIGLGSFAAIILFGDLHSVHERYMTPILMPVPFWLALLWPLESYARGPIRFLRIGGAVAVLMVTAWPLWIAFGREQFAYPYGAFAATLKQQTAEPLAVLAQQEKFAANIAIRLERALIWEAGSTSDRAILLWEPKSDQPPRGLVAKLGDRFEPSGEVIRMRAPYDNFSGEEARLNAQFYARKP